jgi:predicted alpha/beta-fold hydrolase
MPSGGNPGAAVTEVEAGWTAPSEAGSLPPVSVAAHLRTVAHRLRETLAPPEAPPSEPWSTTVVDPRIGPVRLTGRLTAGGEGCPRPDPAPARSGSGGESPTEPAPRDEGRPTPLVLLVHGLGGSAESFSLRRAARAAADRGWASLRLNLRGAGLEGEDFYHAGLASDLHAALASPELAAHHPLFAVGFSLGGNLVLRMAAEPADPRLAAVAAVSPPLDLAACADAFDRPGRALYRAYLLSGLKRSYAAVAARRAVPLPPAAARRIRHIREWDDRLVAPRHGFADAADYYRRASAGPLLGRLRVPALVVAADDDPLVPADTLRPLLAGPPPGLEVRWLSGVGHLGFTTEVDLDLAPANAGAGAAGLPASAPAAAADGFEAQLLDWLAARGGAGV